MIDNVDKKPGEPEKVIEQKVLTADDVQAAIAQALEAERRKNQSKVDQIIAEKKAVESKAMTVEERMAQLEAELQRERATAKRKEAKALAGFDDELEQAFIDFSDADKAKDAAVKIKSRMDAEKKTLMDKISELESRLQYGAKAPAKGGSGTVDFSKMSQDEVTEYVKAHPEAEAAVAAAIVASRRKR